MSHPCLFALDAEGPLERRGTGHLLEASLRTFPRDVVAFRTGSRSEQQLEEDLKHKPSRSPAALAAATESGGTVGS